MLEDDKAPTPEQRIQALYGRWLAADCAIAALIAIHPEKAAFADVLRQLAQTAQAALVTATGWIRDDGMRQAFSEQLRAYYGVAGEG